MEVGRSAHDLLLHELDEKQDQHVAHAYGHIRESASEDTPLVSPVTSTGPTDYSNDASAVEALLESKEKEANKADTERSSWAIAGEEATFLGSLSVPMMAAMALEFLPSMALGMMIGHTDAEHSTEILASFQLQDLIIQLLIGCVIGGIGSAVDTKSAHAFGANRLVELWLFTQAGLILYTLCLPFFLAVMFNGAPLLKALGQDPSIADLSGRLMVVTSIVMPPAIVSCAVRSALQAQNLIMPYVISSGIGWFVAGATAYYLAFQTSLSYWGIAIAVPVHWTLKSLILIPFILRNEAFVQAWPGWQPRRAFELMKSLVTLSMSSMLMMFFSMIGLQVISFLAGLLPHADIMISANGIFVALAALTIMPLFGVSLAGAVRIGNALGAGRARRASIISMMVMAGCVSIAMIGMAVMPLIARPFAYAYTPNEEAADAAVYLVNTTMYVVPCIGFTFGFQAVFRACGRQFLCALFNFACSFVVGVPLGLLFAMKGELGIVGLWYGHIIGLCIYAVSGLVWLYQLSWESMAHEARSTTIVRYEKERVKGVA